MDRDATWFRFIFSLCHPKLEERVGKEDGNKRVHGSVNVRASSIEERGHAKGEKGGGGRREGVPAICLKFP